jgi:hypothetical protein
MSRTGKRSEFRLRLAASRWTVEIYVADRRGEVHPPLPKGVRRRHLEYAEEAWERSVEEIAQKDRVVREAIASSFDDENKPIGLFD